MIQSAAVNAYLAAAMIVHTKLNAAHDNSDGDLPGTAQKLAIIT